MSYTSNDKPLKPALKSPAKSQDSHEAIDHDQSTEMYSNGKTPKNLVPELQRDMARISEHAIHLQTLLDAISQTTGESQQRAIAHLGEELTRTSKDRKNDVRRCWSLQGRHDTLHADHRQQAREKADLQDRVAALYEAFQDQTAAVSGHKWVVLDKNDALLNKDRVIAEAVRMIAEKEVIIEAQKKLMMEQERMIGSFC